jgi:RNA polymerase sigma factor (sigma-70 family)
MPQAPLGTVLRHLRHLVGTEGFGELSDAQLLERFVSRREESAFAALLQRHGRLVWSVCRQVLHHEQDAEDAFQATFLALARHAASIRRGQAVGSWLYHVAHRIALKAGIDRTRRRVRERQATTMTQGQSGAQFAWRELQEVLDAELQRLPEKYRSPFVLCCLEGKSKAEAAQMLGWKEGTVSGRLAQARKLLQRRLTRRGMMFSAVLCAASVSVEAAAAPASLVRQTIRSATLYATDQAAGAVSAPVAALAKGVTQAMFVSKIKLATLVLLAAGLFAAGLGLLSHQALAARQAEKSVGDKRAAPESGKEAPAAAPGVRAKDEAVKEGKDEALVIKGRVLGPDGKPVVGAKVHFGSKVQAESDKEGAYQVALPRSADERGPYNRASRYWYTVAAEAEGYGIDFRAIGTADKDGNLDLHLVKDDVPIEGRILDLEGRPVAGATIRVARLHADSDESLDVFLKAWKFGPMEAMWGGDYAPLGPIMPGAKASSTKEITRPKWRKLWSPEQWGLLKPVTTDKDGKFRLTGVGRERFVELLVSGPTIQQVPVKVVTRKGIDVKDLSKPDPDYLKQNGQFIRPIMLPFPTLYGSTFEHLVGPTKPVAGVVRDKATGKPLAGVRIVARVGARNIDEITDIETVSDEKGQYKLTGLGKDERYLIGAIAKERSGLLPQSKELNDTEGLKPLTADFDLMRGINVRGRLIDKATRKPVSGMVSYNLLPANPRFLDEGRQNGPIGMAVQQRQFVGENGEFQMTVFPGAGVLFAQADDRRFLPLVVTAEDQKKGIAAGGLGINGGVFIQGNAYRIIDPEEGAEPLKINLEFLSGRTLTGTVVGPDDKPVSGATGILAQRPQMHFGFQATNPALRVEKDSAKFTLDNVDQRRPLFLIFQHPEKNLAGRLEVRGDEKEPLTARLQSGGKVTGRILDAAGQPLVKARIDLLLVNKGGDGPQWHAGLKSVKTDKDGRFTMEGILPEMELVLLVGVADKENELGRTVHSINELTWKAGEAKDLGDVKTTVKTKPDGDK